MAQFTKLSLKILEEMCLYSEKRVYIVIFKSHFSCLKWVIIRSPVHLCFFKILAMDKYSYLYLILFHWKLFLKEVWSHCFSASGDPIWWKRILANSLNSSLEIANFIWNYEGLHHTSLNNLSVSPYLSKY